MAQGPVLVLDRDALSCPEIGVHEGKNCRELPVRGTIGQNSAQVALLESQRQFERRNSQATHPRKKDQ